MRSTVLNKSKLQSALNAFLVKHGVSKGTIEVSTDTDVVWRYSNLEPDCYPIYSITKTFIAVLVMMGAEQKIFGLDDELGDYFDSSIPNWLSKSRVRDLLTHRSGLADYGYLSEYKERLFEEPSYPLTIDSLKALVFQQGSQLTARSSSSPVDSESSEQGFFYSNIGYRLLVEFLESVFSHSFERLLTENILKPCEMHSTFVIASRADFQRTAPAPSRLWSKNPKVQSLLATGIGTVDIRDIYSPDWVAHRLIASNATDLNLFLREVFNERLIGDESIALIRSPLAVSFEHPWIRPRYGYGFLGDPNSKFGSVLGHNGSGPGFSTASFCVERPGRERFYISIALNTDDGDLAENLAFTCVSALQQ